MKKFIKNIQKEFKKLSNFKNTYRQSGGGREYLLLIIILLAAYFIFMYHDMLDTVENSIIFAKSIFHGKLLNFYDLSVAQTRTLFSANYHILIYVIFSIWLMPGYLVAHLLGKNFLYWPIGLLYSKTLIIIVTLIVSYLIYKIIKMCGIKKEKAVFAPFIFLSSFLVFFPVFITSQIDIFSIFFMLLGLIAYLKNKDFWFIICFMIAAPLKMFAILLVLPLILLRYKNLFKASLLTLSTTALIIIEKLLFSGSVIYKYALSSQSSAAIGGLLGSNIKLGRPLTIFIVLYLCLLAYCYISDRKNNQKLIVYIPLFVFGTFLAFSTFNVYWILLMAPFLVINIFVNNKFLNFNILLETINGIAYFLWIAVGGTFVFKDNALTSRLSLAYLNLNRDPNILKFQNTYQFFQKLDINTYYPLFSTIFATTIIIILFLSCPLINFKTKVKEDGIEHWILWLRPILLIMMVGLIMYTYHATTNPISYSNLDRENYYEKVDLIKYDDPQEIIQPIMFDKDLELDELTLKFHNTDEYRNNLSLLTIEIWNKTEEKKIFEEQIGCTDIENDKLRYINLKGTKVNDDDKYEIRLSGIKGINHNKNSDKLYTYFIEERDDSLKRVIIDGNEEDKTLYFAIR